MMEGADKNAEYVCRHGQLLKRVFSYALKHKKANLEEQIIYLDDKDLYPRKNNYKKEAKNLDLIGHDKIESNEINLIGKVAEENNTLLLRIIKTAKYSGMRRSEILGLQKKFILNDRIWVVLQLSKPRGQGFSLIPTKTREGQRAIPMIKQLKRSFKRATKRAGKSIDIVGEKAWQDPFKGLVFTLEDGRPIDPNLCSKWFRKAREKADLRKEVKFHHLRHFFVSALSAMGVTKAVRKELVGHADANFNEEVYTHAFRENVLEAKDLLETFYEKKKP